MSGDHSDIFPFTGNEYLQKRYGIPSRRYPAWLPTAIIVGVVGGSWLLWSANHYAKPEIRSTLISFISTKKESISLRYSVQFRDLTKSHTCQLIARDFQANTVGQIDDTFSAGTTFATHSTLIPTRVQAVNAGIARCFTP